MIGSYKRASSTFGFEVGINLENSACMTFKNHLPILSLQARGATIGAWLLILRLGWRKQSNANCRTFAR